MSNNELIDKIVENVGQEKFDEIILRIYSAGVISELNFDRETMDNIILPLSQLGIIKVEDKYFPPGGRPSNERTRYYLFSISSRKIIDSVLERLNLKKIFDVFISKYPVRLLSFIVFFLIKDNVYSEYLEEEYENLVERMKTAQFVNAFKQDVQKHCCGFIIQRFTSKNLLSSTDLILVPEFVNLLRQELPISKIEREEKKLKLVNYIESFFLNPPTNRGWYEEFLKIIGEEGMQDIFEEWLKELESEEILVKSVVLQSSKLKEFLNRKVEEVQEFLIAESRKEERIKEFLEALKQENIELEDEDKVHILSPCEDSSDFSIFISSIYKILHDQLKIKDEYIDAIRCRFHHKKTDKQQGYYEMKFKEFCGSILINHPPANKDEWERLKGKIIEQAIKSLKNQ